MVGLMMPNNIHKLLLETEEAYYWAGFLTADGSFSKNFRLSLKLSKKDKSHEYKFRNFIGYSGYATICTGNGQFLCFLRDTAKKLPCLDRKWSCITKASNRYKNSQKLKNLIKKLLRIKKQTEVAKILGISNGYVCRIAGEV